MAGVMNARMMGLRGEGEGPEVLGKAENFNKWRTSI